MTDRSEIGVVAEALEAEFQRIQRRRQIVIWRDAAQSVITALDAHRIAGADGVAERLISWPARENASTYNYEIQGVATGNTYTCKGVIPISPKIAMREASALILAQKAEIERLREALDWIGQRWSYPPETLSRHARQALGDKSHD